MFCWMARRIHVCARLILAETERPRTLMVVEAITMQTPAGEAKMRFADSWVLENGKIKIHFAGMTQYPDGAVA